MWVCTEKVSCYQTLAIQPVDHFLRAPRKRQIKLSFAPRKRLPMTDARKRLLEPQLTSRVIDIAGENAPIISRKQTILQKHENGETREV